MTAKFWAVIPAAGVGKRMQADRPKQYLPLLGKTVLEHTLDCFFQHPQIEGVVVAISPEDPYWADLNLLNQSPKPLFIAEGGKERCDTVLNALLRLAQHADSQDWVLVHDAARPCLTQSELDRLLMTLADDDVGGMLAIPVSDTMKRAQSNHPPHIAYTEEREGLWHAFTPQMFRLDALCKALKKALTDHYHVTDDASAMEYSGLHPRLVEGLRSNLKITRPDDLALAEFFLQRQNR